MDITKIEIDQKDTLEEIFQIYETSFPANERQTLETLKIRLKEDKEVLFAAKINNEVVGIGFLFDLRGSDFLLLDYLAVKENHRGQQIGERLFEFLKSYSKRHHKHLLMEVDDPEYGEDKPSRIKRIAFYQKNGAYWLKDVKYILPALDKTLPTEQILMVVPKNVESEFSGQEIHRLVKVLYSELYGISGEDEDNLLKIVSSIAKKVQVSKFL
ncbi:GNAT family N-acetyltransferase [Lacihabitans soyangensis]|uniref:GNAT family N-acetyltransferase n=1 Tax=Lacihabitans soyangensis TaxID=869394 RepID=A0AAE3H2Q4_9BACT|nr:GNAT family N-acetyltransferase [Lacihabitans soyangensis]MCP9761775.1 GNAT family N-acetyltransferase [Lacihabitans soyangensis]